MNRNSVLTVVLFFGAGLSFSTGANALETRAAKNATKPVMTATAAWTEGEVLRVDKAASTATIKHGPMPKLDMPPMTMPYRVKDKALLDGLKPGDKIRFDADAVSGVFTVVRLEKLK